MNNEPVAGQIAYAAPDAGGGITLTSELAKTSGWDVFISYTRTDALAQADALHKALIAAGLRAFKDDRALRPGQRWFGAIEYALTGCRHFIVLLGPSGLDRWVGAETQVALTCHFGAAQGATRPQIVPVLLEGAPPQVMRTFLAQFQSIHWPAEQGEPPIELLATVTAASANQAERLPIEGCPYRGLAAFQRDDAKLFFGRERDIVALLARLGEVDPSRPGDGSQGFAAARRQLRWLNIVGGSGTGKSSLLRAGLLPMVKAGALAARTGIERWSIVGPILPGADPVLELAKALSAALDPAGRRDSAALLERLRNTGSADADQTLSLWLADRLADDPGRAVLLVVDQFEELFTLASAAARQRFDVLLAMALQAVDPAAASHSLYLATTCRSDQVHRLAEHLPALAQQVNTLSQPYVLAPMGLPELRRAIECPAAIACLDVSEIVQALLQDARDDLAGALPLVQHALTTLFMARVLGPGTDGKVHPGGRLTLKSLDDAGRLAGILAREADAVLDRLEHELGKSARHGAMELLLALSHYQADGRHTRQHLEVDAALRVAGQGDSPAAMATGRQVLDILAGRRERARTDAGLRLLSIDDTRVDLIHEALLRSRDGRPYWSTLVDYLNCHKERDLQRLNLRHAAQTWAQSKGAWRRYAASAGWVDRRRWKPLRHGACEMELDFLRRSRGPAALNLVVFVIVGLVGSLMLASMFAYVALQAAESVWSSAVNARALLDGINTVRWNLTAPPPPPRTVEVALDRFTMGCKPGRDDVAGIECDSTEEPHEVDLRGRSGACTAYGVFEISFDEYDYYVWSQRHLPSVERPNQA